jgi:hypothetical protein
VLTNIANINAFGAIDASGGFEWKMHANWSLWIDYDHIFRRSDTLTFSGVGGASAGASGATSTKYSSESTIVSAAPFVARQQLTVV